MNETLNDILDTVQRTAVQVSDVAADAAYGAGKKAEELLSVAKLRVRLAGLERSVTRCMTEIGQLLYATHTGTPTDSAILQTKLEEIDALKAEIAQINAAIQKEEEAHRCPTCGAFVREGDQYCRECGWKL